MLPGHFLDAVNNRRSVNIPVSKPYGSHASLSPVKCCSISAERRYRQQSKSGAKRAH
jgi:hypothetical protein